MPAFFILIICNAISALLYCRQSVFQAKWIEPSDSCSKLKPLPIVKLALPSCLRRLRLEPHSFRLRASKPSDVTMKSALTVFSVSLVFSVVSCKPLSTKVTSQDCLAATPANFTRIYIGTPAHGGQQSGTSFDDPLDGTTAAKFDTILRSIVEVQNPSWGAQRNIASENLIVCLASGTFQTEGQYDWTIGVSHAQDSVRGFTVGKNWKIHGSGTGRTTLRLASFV